MMLLENVKKYDLGFRVYPFVLDTVKRGKKLKYNVG
jgi:hypothetical protein